MGQYVIGAIEVVVGIYTENYSLVAMGAATIIGAALTPKPPTLQGPRLNDLKVQVSTYGTFIPINYGATRHAGNVIWSTPKIETKHTSGGGKGGSSKPKEETYTYSQSFAIALCEGPIIGVRRIWANGKIIYNLGAYANTGTVSASNRIATGFRVHTGSATQLPDALIQANVGIANCPAYRDTAYIVFENLELANFYNQTPNLEFEIISAGATANLRRISLVTQDPTLIGFGGNLNSYTPPGVNLGSPVILSADGVLRVSVVGIDSTSKVPVYIFDLDGNYIGTDSRRENENFPPMYITAINAYGHPIGLMDGMPVVLVHSTDVIGAFSSQIVINGVYELTRNLPRGESIISLTLSADGKRLLVITSDNVSLTKWYMLNSNADILSAGTSTTLDNSTFGYGVAGGGTPSIWSASMMENDYSTVWGCYTQSAGPVVYYKINGSNLTLGETFNGAFVGKGGSYPSIYANNGMAWVVSGDIVESFTRTASVSLTTTSVSSVVSDICIRAGLQPSDIDVTQLSDICDGYTVTNLSTARAAIEPLMQAYYFNALESDGKIKFVKRGQSPVALIPENDLAAHPYGAQMPDQMQTVRKQEMDLPMEVTIQYQDKDADYLVGDQYSRRLTTSSKNVASIQMAMSLSASKAKQITDVLRYDAWASRTSRSFQTSDKYSWLEPTDVVQAVKGGVTYTVRIINKDQSGGICKFVAVDEDITVYTQNAVGASLPLPSQIIDTIGQTYLYLLDIPLLRDQDDGVGFYAAACGYISSWHGAQIFKSSDSGASWSPFGSAILNASTMGTVTTVLGNFLSGNIFDELNSVTVRVFNGTLSSINEIAVLNGGNVGLIGGEIIQFKNATLTGTSTYKLTGLLRGRQGTEWAMSTHAIGDRFVLLNASSTYIEGALSSEYNLARKYRGVTFGGFLSDASDINFTDTAVAQKPYAPVQLGGGRDASGNITGNWIRRTRTTGSWNNLTDVPLGEASESYDVEIWNAGYTTLKRTFAALITPTVPYTSAQQVTDFGSNQSPVYIRVYQNSATVGRGYKLEGTV
jgi:hypothetical protein